MGKSSLIAHTAEQLNATTHHAVLIDLSQFPLPPREEEWFHKIVRILDDSLDLSTDPVAWWENHKEIAPSLRLTQLITEIILPELTSPLVLFIDEIERTSALPFREHFFEWLARLYESRATNSILYQLSFVVCGVATPSQLIPEDRPLLFQWSHRVVLSDFTLPEALLLAEGLTLPTEAATEAVQWVYRWTSGHPYLTQLLCQLLEGQHRITWLESEVDECIEHFMTSPQGLREPNFQFIRTALTEPTADGESLLEPYLDLLEGQTEKLRANQSALEQLRLVGVLREDDEDISIRNLLYQKVFSPAWVKRHLHVPAPLITAPEPPSDPSPSPVLQPMSVLPPPARQHSYVMAASLFLAGVVLLIWFFRGPNPTPLPVSEQEISSKAIETTAPSSDTSEAPEHTPQPAALTQAQEKIQALEATIATYQRLSNEERESQHTQRTQLETQLHAQETTVSELRAEVQHVKEELLNQQQTAQQAQLNLESDRAKLEGALASTTAQRNAAQQEAKTLQTALLKQSSLSPSEIKELVADRNQLEATLTTVNQELNKAQQNARALTAALAQKEASAKTEVNRFERDRAQLETQLNTLQAELRQTKESLKQTEQHSQEQQNLAQQELTRLQQARASIQDQLAGKQQLLSEHQKRLATLEAERTKYRQDLQESLAANTTLLAQLQGSQLTETQLQKRVAQLENDYNRNQETADAKQSALQQERDHLSQELANAQANFETTNNRLTTLSTQLASAKQELANRQVAIRDIHTASSEKTQLAENQLTALLQERTDLESRLHQNESALTHAQQRIAELENHSVKMSNLTQTLEATKKENQILTAKLSSTQQQFDTLQARLKKAPTVTPGKSVATSPSTASIPTSQINRILPLITTAITTSSTDSLSQTAKLLWARQAFLFSLRSGGNESASIDRFLREGLHASPIQLKGAAGRVHSLTFDPSGDHVIAGTSEGTMLVWSINHPTHSPQTYTGHTAGVVSVAVSPDGQRLASGSLDSTIRLWSLSQPNTPPRILQAHTKGITSLAFRPDGKELVSGSQDHTIRLWDLTKDQPQSIELGKHDGRVNAIAYTPDGKTLLSGGDDLTLRVWDLQRTDSPPKILRGHQQSIATVAIHPSGWIVATGSRDRQIGVWNLRQPLPSPVFLTGSTGRISQVQFNNDGTTVASVGSDKSLRMWNWNDTTQPPIEFPKHRGTLEAMAFSPDGRTIAVGGSSQTVTLWAGTEQLAHAVCDTAKENLSFDEWVRIVGANIPYERTCPNLPLHPSFLEEGKRLARQGSRDQAQTIFERAKVLDPYLELDPKKEIEKLDS
jgi:predicted  nucleic acid-binding Zn-ribbon protein